MRHALPSLILLVSVLAACVHTTPGSTSAKNTHASAAPVPSPSHAPPSSVPTSLPAVASRLLLPPPGTSTLVSGVIALDPAYAVSSGAAKLISDNGGSVLSTGSSGLVSDAGGQQLAGDPAGIASHAGAALTGGARIVSDAGGQLTSQPLIANNSGNLVSNNSGSLISNNGGGLVSNNGGGLKTFGLLDATTAEAFKPVGGMLVGAYSLAANGFLPLGVDGKGVTVYAVYTNAAGQFTLHLPTDERNNVLIVSSVPGTQDPRLAVDRVTLADATSGLQVDDGTTVVTTYFRYSLLGRLEGVEAPDACAPSGPPLNQAMDPFTYATQAFAADFSGPDFVALARPARERVLLRFADEAIARAQLDSVQINASVEPHSKATGPALPLLKSLLAQLEGAASAKLATDPHYFDTRPYVAVANLTSATPIQIRKPGDLAEFCIQQFLTTPDPDQRTRMTAVLVDIGLPASLEFDLTAAGGSLFEGLIAPLANDVDAIHVALAQAIKVESTPPLATAPPCVPLPTPPVTQGDVSLLAGTGTAGWLDGLAAAAHFDEPQRLVVDAHGHLYVSEAKGGHIRIIDLQTAGNPVTTLVGTGNSGLLDGPAAKALFNTPQGLAIDPATDTMYVADAGNHDIRAIAGFDTASPTVTTLAGDATPGDSTASDAHQGYADGPGASARFNFPQDVALGSDGALYVADTGNNCIRRIGLTDPAHPVTTVVGSGDDNDYDGFGLLAGVREPSAFAVGPAGQLLVTDSHNGLVRWLSAGGGIGLFAGASKDGANDGNFDTANFNQPHALAALANGNLLLADTQNQRIRELSLSGFVTTVAGGGDTGKTAGSYAEGHGTDARFNNPEGLTVAPDGTVYVADTANHRVRKLVLP